MKPRSSIFVRLAALGSLAVASAYSQGDPALNATALRIETSTNQILAVVQQQLEKAEQQTQAIEDQLKRIGDPAAVTLETLQTIKDDIASAGEAALTSVDREERLRATTGAEAFGDKSYGLTNAVGEQSILEDGTAVDRDPERYKLEAALMTELEAYEAKSRENEERKASLMERYAEHLQAMNDAPDLATVLKEQALLEVITGQIAECTAASVKAKQDYDATKEKLLLAAQINLKAKAEDRKLQAEANATAAEEEAEANPQSSRQVLLSPGRLPWGSRAETAPAE